MAIEREHKYLVKDASFKKQAVEVKRIMQGYLARSPKCTVRVRIANDDAFLTVKGKVQGDSRLEMEYSIPKEDALQLLALCPGRIIDKTRYIVPFKGKRWEVDEFHGDLSWLVMAEIELSPDEPADYELPSWAGDNVTGNPRYYNSNL